MNIVFAEFWSRNQIDLDNIKKFFPNATIHEYNEKNTTIAYDRDHPRCGNRMNDLYKIEGLLNLEDGFGLALDADMKIVSEDVKTIVPLIKKFGLCLPSNPRLLVRIDTLIGADSDRGLDDTNGNGFAFNSAIIGYDVDNAQATRVLLETRDIMLKTPMRLPLALWRAVYKTGFYPCLLPPQWCVCAGNEGVGDEIVLHVGHPEVRDYYA